MLVLAACRAIVESFEKMQQQRDMGVLGYPGTNLSSGSSNTGSSSSSTPEANSLYRDQGPTPQVTI